MENKDYQKNAGFCCMAMFIGLLATVSLSVSGNYAGAALFTGIIIFSAIMLYMSREDYKIYQSFQRRIQNKPVRKQLIYILKHPEGENAYLHYGTPEEFERFREYIETLSGTDDFIDDFQEFLEKAKKYNRLK